MPKPAVTKSDLRERQKRKEEWKMFRRTYLLPQRRLAELLDISVRTVQHTEAGQFTPLPSTQRRFAALKARYHAGKWMTA